MFNNRKAQAQLKFIFEFLDFKTYFPIIEEFNFPVKKFWSLRSLTYQVNIKFPNERFTRWHCLNLKPLINCSTNN